MQIIFNEIFMKKIILLLFTAFYVCCNTMYAQSSADAFIKKAQRAYGRNEYKEAFELLRNAASATWEEERKTGKKQPETHYRITKERVQMYIQLRNSKRAKDQLDRLVENAKAAKSDSLNNDLLYTQANVYYTFGESTKGDACINELINKFKAQKQYEEVNECYQNLIGIARRAGNASMMARTYEKFMLWNDSVKALTAQDEYNALKQKYDASLQTIDDKDSSLSTKQYIIIGLCVLAAVLAAVLVLGAIVLLRFIFLTRKQKKMIQTANEHNELKTQFIQNISAQMEPTLASLPAHLSGVQALREFSAHIQELSALESTQEENYETEEKNVSTFCENIADAVRGQLQPEVTLILNVPKLSTKISPEPLKQVLTHLLKNAAEYTPAGGRITLDFKKRGAHTHQFIISDTGCGIAEEKRENLFKPFAEVKDLTQGDGLGLPICSLIATKMNGTLSLDSAYSKGSRFVLELHV